MEIFWKKCIRARSEADLGRSAGSSAHSTPGTRGKAPERADRPAPRVSAPGTETVWRAPGPSDQVGIDGPWLSSTSGRDSQGGNPSVARPSAGAHLGASPAMRRWWGGAADDGDPGDGLHRRFRRPDADLCDGSSELPIGLAGISALASLDQEKGRVR
jgi:hypothetical protein